MTANRKAPARSKADFEYLLSTKLFCGDCGRLMAGECGTGKSTKKYYYYKCSGAKRHLGCHRKPLKKDWIEQAVVYITAKKVLTDKNIEKIADAIVSLQEEDDVLIPSLTAQLKNCEKGIENLVNAIQSGILTDSTKERLEKLEKQKELLNIEILQRQIARPKYTKEAIVTWMNRFRSGDIHDVAYQREIIDTFLNSVYVYSDRLVFTYNFKDGTDTLTLREIEAAFCSDLKNSALPKKAGEEPSSPAFFYCAKMA